MNGTSISAAGGELVARYAARIEVHLARLARGHDPFGHLFGIERLARGAKAEWWETQREPSREQPGR